AVGRTKRRRVARAAGGIGGKARLPEGLGHLRIAVLRLILYRDLAIPARGVLGLARGAVGAQRGVELVGLALVLQARARTQVGVQREAVRRRVEHQLLHLLAV